MTKSSSSVTRAQTLDIDYKFLKSMFQNHRHVLNSWKKS